MLGATGSIGGSTLRVIERHADRLELVGAVARSRLDALVDIARRFGVPALGIYDPGTAGAVSGLPDGTKLFTGIDWVSELVATTAADIVLVASAGTAALRPTLAAIEAGRTIALANKDCCSPPRADRFGTFPWSNSGTSRPPRRSRIQTGRWDRR